jgi:hypothetical protein
MVEAKLLRKKLKNGLIVDKWDLVTIIEKQQAEIDSLRKNLDVALMIVNKTELTDEEITQVFDECYPNNADGDVVTLVDFARAILRKAQKK